MPVRRSATDLPAMLLSRLWIGVALHGRRLVHRGAELALRCARSPGSSNGLPGFVAFGVCVFFALAAAAQTPPGTVIVNQASVRYVGSSGIERRAASNVVETVTSTARTPASLVFTRLAPSAATYFEPLGPSACWVGDGFVPLAHPASLAGSPIDPNTAHMTADASIHHGGHPLFLRLEDLDQDRDASVRDVVETTISTAGGDTERVRLTETAASSGVFTGYVPTRIATPVPGDCILQTSVASSLAADYVDADDAADATRATLLTDPVSRVFDARTGVPVDGVRITLLDAVTGAPAAPLSDDGVSVFPASVTSGGSVVDGVGQTLVYGKGEYRFPVVPPGRYRFAVEPPVGYAAPSLATVDDLQSLGTAPFVLGDASFGRTFVVAGAPVFNADIPVDPAAGALFIDKRASTDIAAAGDFVEFQLTVTHGSGLESAKAVRIVDELPAGLRYASGSARVMPAGTVLEPTISDDGRGLEFAIGDLAADASVTLRYVTAVVPGTQAQQIVNVARALSLDGVSNEARASIQITNDLFRNSAFLAGRVVLGHCAAIDVGEEQGVAGVRVYLEDGRFAVSDAAGRFHFEGLRPGAHVAQLDLESLPGDLELEPCTGDMRFARNGFSRFVDLQPGELDRADFYVRMKPPPSGEFAIELSQESDGQEFDYTLGVASSTEVDAQHVELMVMLPDGVDYVDGSARRVDGSAVAVRSAGQALTFDLGAVDGGQEQSLVFSASPRHETDGALATRALARFEFAGEQAQTPIVSTAARVTPATMFSREYVLNLRFETLSAALRDEDRAALDAVIDDWRGVDALRIEAAGHTDYLPISPRSQSVFSDNYALSEARAHAAVAYLRTALEVDPSRIAVMGLGPDQPIADNRTPDGRAHNRRVEIRISGVARDAPRRVAIERGRSDREHAVVEGHAPELPTMTIASVGDESQDMPVPVMPEFSLEKLEPGTELLWPDDSFAPAIPNTKVVLKHGLTDTAKLYLNGSPVSPLNFEGTERDEETGIALSRWRGIDLAEGPNTIDVEVVGADGREQRLHRALHFAGAAVRGQIVEPESVLTADGRTRPAIAVRFVDKWGQPARRGSVGRFEVEAPYRSWWEIERLRENSVIVTGDRSPSFRIGAGGLAVIELEPTTTAGEVKLRIDYAQDYPQELRVWLRPSAREWILVGLAEGTVGYSAISGSMEAAGAAGLDDDYFEDGRLAFFAKGRVKGALLTTAFDTDGGRDDELNPFGGVIDPDRYYTLYGDNTEQRFDAPSRERLYLKIEKDAFFAMFGDFETGMTITDLARYSRSLTGFKAEQVGERLSYTAFAADTDQSFIKDELRGDGTSGPYQLSRRPILAGSDKLQLEVRDRFQPERIVSVRMLERHFDYDIDYLAGTIHFREPIANRDFAFNPLYIVVDYESRDAAARGSLIGGRAAVAVGAERSEVGLSFVRDGTTGAEGTLVGTDMRYRIGQASEVRAEYAVSDVVHPGAGTAQADAYLVEFEHQRAGRQLQAYLRETEEGFGLGQQRATEGGTRRSGVQLRNELSEAWTLQGEAFRQENLRDASTRNVFEASGRYQDRRRIGNAGLRRVEEDLGAQSIDSMQAVVGGSWKFFDELLTTRINAETALSGQGQSVDYPTRTLLGLDVALGPKITVFGERELTDGDAFDSRMTRIGARANPTDRSRVDSSFSSEMTEYGPRNFANLGMSQGWNLGEHWVLDLGFERSKLLSVGPVARVDERVPIASGSLAGDFTSSFLGFGYRAADWSLTNRFELRDAGMDRHRALMSAFYRERVSGRGFSAELHLLDRTAAAGAANFDGRLRLGWARRPSDSRWIVFNRADWTATDTSGIDYGVASERLLNNFNAHFRASYKQSLGLQYAVKYVRSEFEGFTGKGVLNLLGFDWRRRLDERFDFGLHGSWYQAVAQDVVERGFGADVGFSAARNLVVHFGYNFTGFEDEDFAQARYTARGPYVRFSLKIDQASLKELLRR